MPWAKGSASGLWGYEKKDGGIFPSSFSTKRLFDMKFALYLIGQTRTIFGTVFFDIEKFFDFLMVHFYNEKNECSHFI